MRTRPCGARLCADCAARSASSRTCLTAATSAIDVVDGREQAVLTVPAVSEDAPIVGRHDRRARGHGLERREREGLIARRADVDRGLAQVPSEHLLGRGDDGVARARAPPGRVGSDPDDARPRGGSHARRAATCRATSMPLKADAVRTDEDDAAVLGAWRLRDRTPLCRLRCLCGGRRSRSARRERSQPLPRR